MRKPTTRLLAVGIIICLLTLAGITLGFARQGLRHIRPTVALKQAEQDWQEKRTGASLRGYVHAYGMAIEAGARWTLAQSAIDQMEAARAAGQFDRALASCSRAVSVLHGFDDEGSLSYECFTLEAEVESHLEMK